MSAAISTQAASRGTIHRRRNPINLPHLMLRALYGAAGVGAVISLYAKAVALVEDPMPAAMLTLTVAMLFLAAASRPARRS